MCAYMLHTPQLSLQHIQARFPSFHSKCTLASRRNLKIHVQPLLLAGFSVHFTSAEQFQQELLQFRLYLHTYLKSPSLSSALFPSLLPNSSLLLLLSFSEFKHNQQISKQNKMDWTREVRNQLHQTWKAVWKAQGKNPTEIFPCLPLFSTMDSPVFAISKSWKLYGKLGFPIFAILNWNSSFQNTNALSVNSFLKNIQICVALFVFYLYLHLKSPSIRVNKQNLITRKNGQKLLSLDSSMH